MKVVTFKLEEDLLEQLDKYAIKNGLKRSEAIRKAIELLVRQELEKESISSAKIEKGDRLW